MNEGQWEMYLYHCCNCDLTFAVDTDYEDHSDIVCPVCRDESPLRDAGCATVLRTQEPEGSE